MKHPTYVELDGHSYVILPREEYERLLGLEKVAGLPSLPEANPDGTYPAVKYLRASIARNVVRDRVELGLTQRELARLAGLRVETLCRIETGKHTASTTTVEKLDRALRQARERASKAKAPKARTRSRRGRKAS